MNAPDVMAADLSWFRDHLTTDILPHWLRCPVTDAGLYLPCLDRRWQPVACPFATLVSQSRLLYVLSQGYRLTGSGEYRVAVTRGAACLLEQFRDDQYGGWYQTVTRDGTVTADAKGNEWKVDYHATGLCMEAVRLQVK